MLPPHAFDWGVGVAAGLIVALWVLHRRHAYSLFACLSIALAWVGVWIGASLQFRLEILPIGAALSPFSKPFPYPGMRLPIGLLVGTVVGLGSARIFRLDWRSVGDALAVNFATALVLGRIGCLRAGCCNGMVCALELPWCVRHEIGTGAHGMQLAAEVIDPGAVFSLPAHPLPIYFALSAAALLVLMVAQLRAGVARGTLLLTFLLLWPPLKAILEAMRAIPRPVMITVSATLAMFLAAILWMAVERAKRTEQSTAKAGRPQRVRRSAIGLLLMGPSVGAFLLGCPLTVRAQSPESCDAGCWSTALQAYAGDPNGNRDSFLALERHLEEGVSPILLLALADARLRKGQVADAGRLFSAAAERLPDTMWADWGNLGGSYVSLRKGDLVDARRRLEFVENRSPGGEALAAMLSASIDIMEGDPVQARETLGLVAQDESASASLLRSADQLAALTYYWEGRPLAAATRLEALAKVQPEERDALEYAAAVARIEGGDRAMGMQTLRRLSEVESQSPGGFLPGALLRLEPAALLARGFNDYRKSPLSMEPRFVVGLPLNGPAFSRAMLEELRPSGRWPSRVGRSAPYTAEGSSTGATSGKDVPPPQGFAKSPPDLAPDALGWGLSSAWPAWLWVIFLIAAVVIISMLLRRLSA